MTLSCGIWHGCWDAGGSRFLLALSGLPVLLPLMFSPKGNFLRGLAFCSRFISALVTEPAPLSRGLSSNSQSSHKSDICLSNLLYFCLTSLQLVFPLASFQPSSSSTPSSSFLSSPSPVNSRRSPSFSQIFPVSSVPFYSPSSDSTPSFTGELDVEKLLVEFKDCNGLPVRTEVSSLPSSHPVSLGRTPSEKPKKCCKSMNMTGQRSAFAQGSFQSHAFCVCAPTWSVPC